MRAVEIGQNILHEKRLELGVEGFLAEMIVSRVSYNLLGGAYSLDNRFSQSVKDLHGSFSFPSGALFGILSND